MAEVISSQKKHIMGGNLVLYESMKKYERDFDSNSNYGRSSFWTLTENKIFEKALAMYDSKTPDRWQKIVAMLPGKTPSDAYKHYQVLEADVNSIDEGLVDIPSYSTSSFTLELGDDRDGFKRRVKGCEQERKKGVPWTEEEHRLFLLGLEKYGKGDWRSISRNLVVTKTPTQVASHAQKYFIRLSSGSKDRRRSSIHDITTANVSDKRLPSLTRSSGLATQSSPGSAPSTPSGFSLLFDPNQTGEGAILTNSGACLSQGSFSVPSYAVGAYANNFGTQHFQRNMLHDSHLVHNSAFQMQPAIHSYQG
ncbi:transcription factor DIVARICATA-like [Nymphaea colorata]|nr:transcription factor DIVARICATA-like [Nymphaea colorata]